MSKNITYVEHKVTRGARWVRNAHRGGVVWFTGLSASGKSTLASMLEQRLFGDGYQVFMLDGDNVRHGLCSDLGFTETDREENIRRIGEMAGLFAEAGFIVVTAFISPYRRDRVLARKIAGEHFHEVYLSAELAACEARDPKGLYAKARAGDLPDFTGVSAPYEPPEQAELVVDSGRLDADACLDEIVDYVETHFPLKD